MHIYIENVLAALLVFFIEIVIILVNVMNQPNIEMLHSWNLIECA